MLFKHLNPLIIKVKLLMRFKENVYCELNKNHISQ